MNRASMAKQITEAPMACKKKGMKKGGLVQVSKKMPVRPAKKCKQY